MINYKSENFEVIDLMPEYIYQLEYPALRGFKTKTLKANLLDLLNINDNVALKPVKNQITTL